MDGSEEGQQRNCGRHIFREADLAYLLIDGEKMFPLAELLASLFSNTARTTLFTRMEKINTRRHFCSAEEIKLLKTVNGIHGSSAICTLIPEADVQKYCDVYIDRTVDVRLFSTTIRRSKSAKDSSKIKASKQDRGITKTSNSNAKTSEGKSPSITNVESDKDSKSLKGKKAAIGKLKFNKQGKAKVPWEVETSYASNLTALHVECLESIKTSEHTNSLAVRLAEHVLKGTQTVQTTDRRGVKARKKRKGKDCPEDKDTHEKNKKAKRSVKLKESESFPCRPWEHCTGKARSDVNDRTRVESCTTNLEHPCGSSLSQCLTNANTEILFSDASSNDSGFASTTISESQLRKTSTCLDTNCRKKPRNLTVILPSPSKPDKSKKLNKARVEHDDDKQRNKNLSPPALVLKRQNNRWQVETKSEQDQRSYNTATNKAKKRLKWPLCNETEDGQLKNQEATSKKKAKKKRKRVTAVDKNESVKGIHHQEIDFDVQSRKIKRKRLDKDGSCKGGLEVIHPHVVNNSSVKVHNARKTVKRGKKSKHVPTSNIQNTKKIAFAKTLKVNKDFKFMSLFSSFPLLSVKDGELCPTVSGVLSKYAERPPPSHPIWKWQQGGPVFVSEGRKKLH